MVALVRLYRAALSPFLGQQCRYYPSCSAYAEEALTRHGAIRGSWLASRRLLRCNPWTRGGVDLVPGSRLEAALLEDSLNASQREGQP